MTNSTWEENMGRLLKNCLRPVTDRQIEVSAARFERRLKPPPSISRLPVAVAALVFMGIVLWIILPPHRSAGTPGAGSSAAPQENKNMVERGEVDNLIIQLGSEDKEDREKAKARLLATGTAALEALDKAYYHENPNVRSIAKELAQAIRERVKVQDFIAAVQARVRTVRAHWIARDFKDIGRVTQDAFSPIRVDYVHYVPKKEIGDHLEANDGNIMSHFFPLSGEGGTRDLLTREVAEALDRNGGLVFLKPVNNSGMKRWSWLGAAREPSEKARLIVDWSPACIFTLPDKKDWSAYILVWMAEGSLSAESHSYAASEKSRLLTSSDVRQVWGIDPKEAEWACAHLKGILDDDLTLSPNESGLKIDRVAEGSIAEVRGLRAGDLVKEINSQPVRTLAEATAVLNGIQKNTVLRIVLERAGKTLVLDYRPLPN